MGAHAVPVALLVALGCATLAGAGLLAAFEAAFGQLSRAGVHDLVLAGRKRAASLERLVAHRARTTYAVRGARVALQTVATVAITLALVALPWPWWAVCLLAVGVVGAAEFALVSVAPGQAARRDPERTALRGTRGAAALERSTHLLDPVLRWARAQRPPSPHTEAEDRAVVAEDLREMVDQVGEDGFEDEDRKMLRSVFELGHTLVREVMVPRTDMVTIEADKSVRKALNLLVRSGYSRVPVIGQDVDDVVGVVYFKDVVSRLMADPAIDARDVRELVRPANFAPEMKPADDLLRQMQREHFHIAMVVDEYGGIAGLVTIEDLLEEVVGEVTDEHDRQALEPQQVAPGVWRVSSRHPIDEVGELLGLQVDDDDVDSVGGLLAKAMGKVPLPGASADAHGVHMRAEEARGRRRQVATILVSRSVGEQAGSRGAHGEEKR